jgi:hypothetical protein
VLCILKECAVYIHTRTQCVLVSEGAGNARLNRTEPKPPPKPYQVAQRACLAVRKALVKIRVSGQGGAGRGGGGDSGTEVKYPLPRACSSSAGLTAAGLHTHVRTHRTSSDPAYL